MEKGQSSKALNEFQVGMQHFHRYMADFVDYKKDFELHQSGTTIMIVCDGKKWRFVDYQGITGKGFHLCKFVNEDAKAYADRHAATLLLPQNKKPNIDLEVQKANPGMLAKMVGQQIYGVDVNDCYWDTAYRKTVLRQETYLRGLKKKEWKVGRNASIGALNKVTVVTKYQAGLKTTAEPVVKDESLAIIRNDIVWSVHEMFMRLLKQLGEDWLMYFTDCVYVPLEKVAEVQEFFLKEGYQTKLNTYQLDKFDLATGKTEWYDYEKNADKTFQFCQRQLTLERKAAFDMPTTKDKGLSENTEFLQE